MDMYLGVNGDDNRLQNGFELVKGGWEMVGNSLGEPDDNIHLQVQFMKRWNKFTPI